MQTQYYWSYYYNNIRNTYNNFFTVHSHAHLFSFFGTHKYFMLWTFMWMNWVSLQSYILWLRAHSALTPECLQSHTHQHQACYPIHLRTFLSPVIDTKFIHLFKSPSLDMKYAINPPLMANICTEWFILLTVK